MSNPTEITIDASVMKGVQKRARPGARIVAHDFGIEGWGPDKTEKLPKPETKAGGLLHFHTLYLWRIGDRVRD